MKYTVTLQRSFRLQIYLILHQLVPQSLVDLTHSYTNKAALTRQIIFGFFTSVQQLLYHNNLREWEKSQHISKKNKR
ncbi:hypothetical protein RhiirA4_413181 [Rhizophagus irregularis]|uniref:Uncharacterized protein n=1 Tax=Rhizophagus irregularis TaxID=588596 RepID=A0A2I1HXC1_9GLOM|nr:hypothetical protein RhiirA4_413181 [Rhizophagus irregularis]